MSIARRKALFVSKDRDKIAQLGRQGGSKGRKRLSKIRLIVSKGAIPFSLKSDEKAADGKVTIE